MRLQSPCSTWPAAVTVNIAAPDSTAGDHTAVNKPVHIAGNWSVGARVPITDDADDKPGETFAVTISDAAGGAENLERGSLHACGPQTTRRCRHRPSEFLSVGRRALRRSLLSAG